MRPSLFALVVAGAAAGVLALPAQAGKETLKFRNGEGQAVDDLHLDLTCASDVASSDPDFPDVGDGKSRVTLAGTEVADGDVVMVVLDHECDPAPKVTSWWWTRGGRQVGAKKRSARNAAGVHVAAPVCEPPLCTVTVTTPEGRLTVYLPDDVAASDRISGTVSAEPAGRTEGERQANGARLTGYVVAVDGEEADEDTGVWTVVLGEAAPRIRIWGGGGPPLAEAPLPEPRPTVPTETPAAAPPGFEAPPIAQGGDPLPVSGPFDGHLDTTTIEIAGRPADVLAESPRGVVVRAPTDVVGPTEIVVADGGEPVHLPVRIVGLGLSAPKLDLRPGERTELIVEVSGLAGLDRPIDLRLVNLSPDVITVEGGNAQDLTIEPSALTPGADRHRLVFPLTGLRTGGFAIEAKAAAAPTRAPCDQEMAKKHRCQEGTCFCETEAKAAGDDWDDQVSDCSCTDADGERKTWAWGQGFPPPIR